MWVKLNCLINRSSNTKSNAHNKTKRRWYPNLQKVRAVKNGQTVRMRVCTRCIKAGFVEKA